MDLTPRLTYLFFPFFLVLILLFLPEPSSSQNTFTGSFQNYNAFKTTPDNELITGRNRVRVNFTHVFDNGTFEFSGDFFQVYANQDEGIDFLPRELFADLYFDRADLRIGKQIITWGNSDLGFVTDLLAPVDLREFLARDESELREGLTAMNYIRYFGSNYIQAVIAPSFSTNRLPDPGSRWFPEPTLPDFIPIEYTRQNLSDGLRNPRLALRYAWRDRLDFDLDLMAYYWPFPLPSYAVEVTPAPSIQNSSVNLIESYHASPMAGFSGAWRPFDQIEFVAEAIYVNERIITYLPVSVTELENALEDLFLAIQLLPEFIPSDDGFLAKKPWINSMVGIQYDLKGWTIRSQFYLEYILNYEEKLLPQELFPFLTLAAQNSFFRDRLNAIATGRYNFYAEDFWIQTQGTYELRDNFELTLGANLFGGPEITPFYGHFTFNRYRTNSFVFVSLTTFFN